MKAVNKVNMMNKVIVQLINELFNGMRVARLRVSGNHDYNDIDANAINPRTQILMRKYSASACE